MFSILKYAVIIIVIHVTYSEFISEYKSYKNYKVFSLMGDGNNIENLLNTLEEHDDSLTFCSSGNTTHVMIAPKLMPLFEETVMKQQLKKQLIYKDFSKLIRDEKLLAARGNEFSWTAYYDVNDMYEYLRNTSRTYSKWTELIVGGESYEGRQILGLRINTPTNNGKDKPVIFIESGIHAREWITPATTTYFINQMLTSASPNISLMRDLFDWRIFPTVNPDGYHYSYTVDRMWRKTRSRSPNGCYGADPNRNWDYNWGQSGSSNNPCSYQLFAGSKAFSEKETRTLSSYMAAIENLLGYISFHSTAQMVLVPYSDSIEHLNNYNDLVRIGKKIVENAYNVNQEKYDGPATAAEILYKVSGGSMDWVREKLGTPLVYTIELRGYYFHWPPNLIYQQGDEVTQMMLGLVTEAENLGYF